MDIRWLDPVEPVPTDLAAAVAVLDAANAVDTPHRLSHTVSSLTGMLRHGWDGDAVSVAVARDVDARPVGVLQLDLPHWDNTHFAYLDITVDPLRRGAGIGRELFELGYRLAGEDGRTVVATGGYESAAAVGFAKALGLDRATEEVERRQDLTVLDRQALAALAEDATRRSPAYDLERLPRWTPDSQLVELARLTGSINDAPTDDLAVEDEVYSAPRIRAFEVAQLAQGRRTYRLIARERSTGRLAGQTLVGVYAERPGFAWQYDTTVAPEHRGHRLGLRLKLGMLDWLAEREPQLRVLDTFNAETNAHMIAVNEALGYRVLGRVLVWQRRL